MTERRQFDPIAILLAALTGATGWISLGALAVTSDRVARIGVLPPLWALPTLMASGAGVAALLRVPRQVAWPLLPVFVLWLPWLPLAITPAALVWEGPLESVVWTASLGGLVLAWLARDQETLNALVAKHHGKGESGFDKVVSIVG